VSEKQLEVDIRNALSLNPELKEIGVKLNQLSNEELLGENKLLPKIDVNFETSRDRGDGSKTLRETENRIFVALEIPIERNLGLGKVRAVRSKKRALNQQRQLFVDQTRAFIKSLYFSLNTSVETIENTRTEVGLAKKLQKAEVEKFKNGASDFFVVNIREQNTADAQVKNIKAHYEYWATKAEYDEVTAKLLREKL